MSMMIGAVVGAVLLFTAREQKKQSWYAATDAQSAGHLRQARVYKIAGWVLIGLCVVLPLGLILLLTLFPPTFTF